MRFEKWHALGNAYLLAELKDAGAMTQERVRRLCDVDTGIGSDGLLEVLDRVGTRARVRIWNPDGSTAELSGNGTRIAAAWLLRESAADTVEIETEARVVRAVRTPLEGVVRQDLGAVAVGAVELLDVAGERISVVPVDVGNPHAVVLRDELSRDELLRLGPAIETHPRFPGRTNVQLARPGPQGSVSILVWERGAGETAASGSSAVAVAAAATSRGWCESPVRVTMPGGELRVAIENGQAVLEGPVELICVGTTEL
ncbi:diaminopimelate epimerase [Gaiella sp.]|uniref:diaminopimelate epimerase n=1 Tax=Gaiella sp. TaxID=2663207 RepID=UPI002BBB4E89|nr:diaminopimelate epimerase [Gaiella sp.]HWO80071.1 diaminopimelate epimerase [Gaiella sp.]